MLVLAAALAELQMAPGKSLPLSLLKPDIQTNSTTGASTDSLVALMRVLFIIGWALIPFYVIYLIISPEARKRFIRDILTLLPIAIILWFFLKEPAGDRMVQNFEFNLPQDVPTQVPSEQVMPQFTANPPDWVVTATTVGLALLATAIFLGIIYFIWRARRERRKERPLQRMADDAQAAINAIRAGGDLRDVIIRCYTDMNKALSEYRNIIRGRGMTPHEFELLLQERGLPMEPIHQLTMLFEQVRYGAYKPGRQEERIALSSLTAIVSACRRVR